MKYQVSCKRHNYRTTLELTKGTAITAARMHALLPCNEVQVINEEGKEVNFKQVKEPSCLNKD